MSSVNPSDAEKRERLERSKREWMARQAARTAASSSTPGPTVRDEGTAKTLESSRSDHFPENSTLEQAEVQNISVRETKQKEGLSGGEGDGENEAPQWRRGGALRKAAIDKADIRLREELRRVNKDLRTACARYSQSSGSAGVRRGLGRLEGTEQHRWAYVDERDVSDFDEVVSEPAMTFDFELDAFQKRAIMHIEAQESVFVAAHTSAGKTVVAEYAIALAGQGGTKVFYTSPIKTLSNQKLRDFRTKFKDVGLVTGDVSINDDAQCVIMTTEILRSMLYRAADVIRDVSYVIFDEVQFLNDEERGVVWEESIIMLPPHISIIMLSATVPNALEFASWVGKTKDRKVAVVSTSKRPVPLRHSWLHRRKDTPDELREAILLEQGGNFKAESFKKAFREAKSKAEYAIPGKAKDASKKKDKTKGKSNGASELRPGSVENEEVSAEVAEPTEIDTTKHDEIKFEAEGKEMKKTLTLKGTNKNKGQTAKQKAEAGMAGGKEGPNSRRSPWVPLVKFLRDKDRTPAVIFCFSKKKCERAVASLETTDLLPDSGKKAYVKRFFQEAMGQLREEDRTLPQVLRAQANLERGISAHHAGLLPLIKEITEILFSKGLVKILFATETFAMGVNMPARTVVFAAIRKHDGRGFRFLEAGEYTQMSGRAGRRGLDDVGNVHLFFPPDEQYPEQRVLEKIMTGDPISLKSAFRLTYNMILNVLRVDELRVEELMKQSFSEADDDSKSESISKVLAKANATMERLMMKDTESDHEDDAGTENIPSSRLSRGHSLATYAKNFSGLLDLCSQLTPRDLNPLLMEGVTHGRVVVAEVSPGLLSLGVVYSIVPRGDQRGTTQTVTSDTKLWIAYVVGVVPSGVRKHIPSVLLLPMRSGTWKNHQSNVPQVTTQSLLVVGLKDIEASKVVYICDQHQKLSARRISDQQIASKELFHKRPTNKWRRSLWANANELDKIVRDWKSSGVFLPEYFDPEKQAMQNAASFEDYGRKSSPATERPKRSRRKWKLPKAYQERLKLCCDLVTNGEVATWLQKEADDTLGSRLEVLLLKQSVQSNITALTEIQERFHRPNLLSEYEKRVQVLQRLGYVADDAMSVQLKGRCGCNVATVDSLILTEIVVENVLQGLEPAEVASLLSCLVCRAKNIGDVHKKDVDVYSEAYREAKTTLREVVRNVGRVQEELQVEVDVEFADGGDDFESAVCRWDLAHAVYAWANGEPFCEITNLTEQQEGDIVVCVKRVSELLRDAQSVAKLVGNDELHEVLEEAITTIRRDVVFNGSLYYQEAGTSPPETLVES